MANVVDRIRKEHANMERLLLILDRQMETFEAAETPDYDLLQEIMFYFSDFPDKCHHPKEDQLAEKLLEADPERAAPLRGLAAQHEELAQLTGRMTTLLERVMMDAEISRDRVAQTTREFIESQRHHMQMEERHFLPLAETLLGKNALNVPQEEIFNREDPLFEAQAEQRYAKLIEEILAWERDLQG